MGYETQLVVGLDTEQKYNEDGIYFMTYATVDMCKIGSSALFNLPTVNKTPDKKHWYFYSICGDGNTPVTEDRYGDMFQPVPLDDVITALEQDVHDSNYRRFKWALALLKSIKETSTEELSVILWGH